MLNIKTVDTVTQNSVKMVETETKIRSLNT